MLRHIHSITSETLAHGAWRADLDRIFEYNPELEARHKVFLVDADKEVPEFDAFVERYRPLLGERRISRVWSLTGQISYYPLANAVPRVIQEYAGPEFFKTSPGGEIWYIEQDIEKLHKAWRDEFEIAKKFAPDSSIEALHFFSPQSFSGLEVGLLPYHSLWLSLAWGHPFVFGTLAAPLRGYVIFLPEWPITDLDDYKWNLTDALLMNVIDIYSDQEVPHRGPRSVFPEALATLPSRKEYLEWAIQGIDSLIEETLRIEHPITRLLIQWTISRIAVETYLIAILDVPILRKTILYHLLDKYASLMHLAEFPFSGLARGQVGEVEAWLAMLRQEMWTQQVMPALSKIPGQVGQFLIHSAEWAYEKLAEGSPTPEQLRAYRNTSHGYTIRDASDLLRDTGEVQNDLPDISLGLWHYLLASEFVDHLRDKSVRLGG